MISDFVGTPNQFFTFKVSDGKYKVYSAINGKVMSVSNDSLFKGSGIRFDNEGHQSENWSIDVCTKQ
jgi:hypothetical protein